MLQKNSWHLKKKGQLYSMAEQMNSACGETRIWTSFLLHMSKIDTTTPLSLWDDAPPTRASSLKS